MSLSIHSPFRYAGGKFYARRLILAHIPSHTYYIEPFAGGASIFFAKPKANRNILNDVDKELIGVYRAIKDRPDDLLNFLKRRTGEISRIPDDLTQSVEIGEPLPATKKLHSFFKSDFEPLDEMDRAGRWFYLNRTSFSGIMNSQNMYWGYGDKFSMQPKNWEANIRRTSEKLQSVILSSADFEEVIDTAPDGAFLFVDPPYYGADQNKFYQHFFSPEDHYRLERCLFRNHQRLKIFLTYDNVQEIRDLYDWMVEFHDKEWNYCIQRTDDQRNGTVRKGERYKGKELFVLNYETETPPTPALPLSFAY